MIGRRRKCKGNKLQSCGYIAPHEMFSPLACPASMPIPCLRRTQFCIQQEMDNLSSTFGRTTGQATDVVALE